MNTNPLAHPYPNPACTLFGRVSHGRVQGEKADELSQLPGLELGRLPVLPHLVRMRTEFQFEAVVASHPEARGRGRRTIGFLSSRLCTMTHIHSPA